MGPATARTQEQAGVTPSPDENWGKREAHYVYRNACLLAFFYCSFALFSLIHTLHIHNHIVRLSCACSKHTRGCMSVPARFESSP